MNDCDEALRLERERHADTLATLNQISNERNEARTERRYWEAEAVRSAQNAEHWQHRAEQAEAALQEAQGRIAAYEKRPWPGCHMLSLGDKCQCSLCKAEQARDALRAELKRVTENLRLLVQTGGSHSTFY